jgi:predicted DNA-binding transcriptional regulator AlpA
MTVSFAAKHDALPLVLSESETARALCISSDTLRRLGERGQAPQRVQLSPRRFGYVRSSVEKFIEERAV